MSTHPHQHNSGDNGPAAPEAFRVDLRGMVELLSRNLYSGPRVFARELLQNGVDAITARREIDPDAPGRIRCVTGPGWLRVTDTGVGLTAAEVRALLATIGASSKLDELGFDRSQYLGQFGIGLLSCFMVSETITVFSRSAREPNAATVKWVGSSSGTWTVEQARPQDIPPELDGPGTTVVLRARPGERYFEAPVLTALIEDYGRFLPFRITVEDAERQGADPTAINDPTPPWEMPVHQAGRWCSEHFGFTPFACLPLKLPALGTEGVAFIMGTGSVPGQATYHDVYIRRMLLGHRITDLLPEWAYFARVVLNTETLKPTASREQLFDDELLEATRAQLGEQIQQWLEDLAAGQPQQFERFVALHIHGLKALAVTDARTREMVLRAVPFPTSQGMLPLKQVMDRAGQIRFVPTLAEYRTVLPILQANGLTVLNAGAPFDEELLAQVALDFPHIPVRRLNTMEIIAAMSPLGASEEAQFLPLLQAAEEALASQRVRVLVRRFQPAAVPAMYLPDEGGAGRQIEQRQQQEGDLLGDIVASAGRAHVRAAERPGAQLVLNADCLVINQLSGVSDRHELTRSAVRGLYVQALLAGHHPLNTQARSWSSSALTTLISLSLAGPAP